MSTKIYHGMRYKVSSISEIPEFLKSVKQIVTPILQEKYDKRVAIDIYRSIDALASGSQPPFEVKEDTALSTSIYKRYMDLANKMESWSRLREPIDDFTFELSVYFAGDYLLLIPICEQKEIFKALLDIPGIESYCYWNNLDREDDVSEEDWDKREKDWNIVIDSDANPLVMHLDQHRFLPGMLKRALQYIPSLEERVESKSKDLVLDDMMAGVEKSEFMRVFMGFGKWLKTKEGKKALREKIEIIEPRLTTGTITAQILDEIPKTFINPSIA